MHESEVLAFEEVKKHGNRKWLLLDQITVPGQPKLEIVFENDYCWLRYFFQTEHYLSLKGIFVT